jgi:glutaredoxin
MITVYGADWCEDTQRSMRHLRRLAVPYHYLNVDEDLDALERATALNHGRRRTPAIDVDGRTLIEPANAVLTDVLVEQGLITPEQVQERMAAQNVGDLERVARVGAGALAFMLADRAPTLLRWPLRLAAGAVALTGVSGWCPAYSAAGVTSLDGPGDHPAEAHRREWTAVRTLAVGRAR